MKENYIVSFELLKNKLSNKDEYPFNLPVVKHLDKVELHKNVTFLVWENGSWKSTLLEALAIQYGFNPEWWSKNFNFSTLDTHSGLSDAIRISKGIKRPKDGFFLRAESFYNLASNIDDIEKEDGWMHGAYGGKSLHEQSHGESFFSLFLNRFFGNGIYILDEPEAALSPQRQLAFLLRMDELVKKNSQLIIATHSPIIMSYPNAKIIEISNSGFKEVQYKESENYTFYKMFLDSPEYILTKMGVNKDEI